MCQVRGAEQSTASGNVKLLATASYQLFWSKKANERALINLWKIVGVVCMISKGFYFSFEIYIHSLVKLN